MNSQDLRLTFVTEVLKLDHLHFGYWESNDALTFENLRKAQHRYTERLLEKIPAGVKAILDVGCGTGATAKQLSDRGYEVVCLSPDSFQKQYVDKKYAGALDFRLTRFEEFSTDARFDLVLSSESFQYLHLPSAFAKARALLNAGGHLLVCDYFRTGAPRTMKMSHKLEDFLAQAAQAGFRLESQEDITDRVVPTLEFGMHFYSRHLVPAVSVVGEYLNAKFPRLTKLAGWACRKELRKLTEFLDRGGPSQLDSKAFADEIRYVVCLFGVSGA